MASPRLIPVLSLVIHALAGCTSAQPPEEAVPSTQAVQSAPAEPSGLSPLGETIEAALFRRASEGFAGSVVVARAGKVVLHQTYGAGGKPAAEGEPAYWVGSIAKQFTGVLVASLARDGKIDLDARIGTYLKSVPVDKQGITIRHLLTHGSGLGQRYAADGIVDRNEALGAILAIDLAHAPGDGYLYSNDGFNLLAIIVEIVTGGTFEDAMRTRVLQPQGLRRTGLWGFEVDDRIVPPLDGQADGGSRAIFSGGRSQANWGYRGATGLSSTAGDLHRWTSKLLAAHGRTGDPLGMIQEATRVVRESQGSRTLYGFGIAVVEQDGQLRMLSHTGDEDWLGHNCVVMAYADGDIIIVLTRAGYQDGTAWSVIVTRDIREALGR